MIVIVMSCDRLAVGCCTYTIMMSCDRLAVGCSTYTGVMSDLIVIQWVDSSELWDAVAISIVMMDVMIRMRMVW